MIRNWLSRYHVRYPRFLVYMLQASEYDVREYLTWYHGTRDFSRVERRKKLIKTPKALLLLAVGWILVLFFVGVAVSVLLIGTSMSAYVLFFAIILLLPYFLAYGIIVPLLVIRIVIQRPVEYLIFAKTRKILKAH